MAADPLRNWRCSCSLGPWPRLAPGGGTGPAGRPAPGAGRGAGRRPVAPRAAALQRSLLHGDPPLTGQASPSAFGSCLRRPGCRARRRAPDPSRRAVAAVAGVAGVGKSRLLVEVVRRSGRLVIAARAVPKPELADAWAGRVAAARGPGSSTKPWPPRSRHQLRRAGRAVARSSAAVLSCSTARPAAPLQPAGGVRMLEAPRRRPTRPRRRRFAGPILQLRLAARWPGCRGWPPSSRSAPTSCARGGALADLRGPR
ncbi:hypothetical protein HBB16_18515 [Pseudonocardia sp. MCCB 268]|nr:hypothetical protein [Pseudonocardia cytotoxica]